MNTSAYNIPFANTIGSVLQPVAVSAHIAAFTVVGPGGVSSIVDTYPITNTGYITIGQPFGGVDDWNPDTTYAVCVSYTENSVTYRYVLFDGNGNVPLNFPVYEGQTLGPSATIEIWSAADTVSISASVALDFTINTLTRYTNNNSPMCFCSTLTGSTLTLVSAGAN